MSDFDSKEMREAVADDLRTFADRLEDGEYAIQHVKVTHPEIGENGLVKIEAMNSDDLARMMKHI